MDNELHLTAENRAAIRALVKRCAPEYEEDLRERREARRERAANDLADTFNKLAAARPTPGAILGQVIPQLAVNIHNPSPLFNRLVANSTTAKPVFYDTGVSYPDPQSATGYAELHKGGGKTWTHYPPPASLIPLGTGFGSAGPVPDQGLTLKGGGRTLKGK